MFAPGASATENSLITAGRSLIVENNYGYQDPFGPDTDYLTEPGFARVDVKKTAAAASCAGPTPTPARRPVVPKLSTETGLIYVYTLPPDPTAPRATTGPRSTFAPARRSWSKYAGSGLAYNNNYAGLALGPDGTAYLGVIGGMIALRDGG